MPEVVRGSRASEDGPRPSMQQPRGVRFDTVAEAEDTLERPPLTTNESGSAGSGLRKQSSDTSRRFERRGTIPLEERADADAYYDSRAATKREFKRRASTLQEYYALNPTLLPQLPFTWHHGWRRWKLFGLIFLIFVDACVMPIVLYYAMKFAGHVQGFIIFAIIATIWGGPTYFEFAIRSWRLIKKENFFRPLGAKSRWSFDYFHWVATGCIAAITAFLVIGSAPHIVWLRILALPGPGLLLVAGCGMLFPTVYNVTGRPAPFPISSTAKGGSVHPGAFYFMEDVVAVNASAGRPYREAVHARYMASPRFRRMLLNQSWFWSIPSIVIGIVLIVLVCIHEVDKNVAYGIGWGIPFVWAAIWGVLSVMWCKRDMRKERLAWESDVQDGIAAENKLANMELASGDEQSQTTAVEPTSRSAPIHTPTTKGEAEPGFSKPDFEPQSSTAEPQATGTDTKAAPSGLYHDTVTDQSPPSRSETEAPQWSPLGSEGAQLSPRQTETMSEAHPTQSEVQPPTDSSQKVVGAGI